MKNIILVLFIISSCQKKSNRNDFLTPEQLEEMTNQIPDPADQKEEHHTIPKDQDFDGDFILNQDEKSFEDQYIVNLPKVDFPPSLKLLFKDKVLNLKKMRTNSGYIYEQFLKHISQYAIKNTYFLTDQKFSLKLKKSFVPPIFQAQYYLPLNHDQVRTIQGIFNDQLKARFYLEFDQLIKNIKNWDLSLSFPPIFSNKNISSTHIDQIEISQKNIYFPKSLLSEKKFLHFNINNFEFNHKNTTFNSQQLINNIQSKNRNIQIIHPQFYQRAYISYQYPLLEYLKTLNIKINNEGRVLSLNRYSNHADGHWIIIGSKTQNINQIQGENIILYFQTKPLNTLKSYQNEVKLNHSYHTKNEISSIPQIIKKLSIKYQKIYYRYNQSQVKHTYFVENPLRGTRIPQECDYHHIHPIEQSSDLTRLDHRFMLENILINNQTIKEHLNKNLIIGFIKRENLEIFPVYHFKIHSIMIKKNTSYQKVGIINHNCPEAVFRQINLPLKDEETIKDASFQFNILGND
jgi:hypothetical protein